MNGNTDAQNAAVNAEARKAFANIGIKFPLGIDMNNVHSKWRNLTGPRSLDDYLAEHYGDKKKFRVSKTTHR